MKQEEEEERGRAQEEGEGGGGLAMLWGDAQHFFQARCRRGTQMGRQAGAKRGKFAGNDMRTQQTRLYQLCLETMLEIGFRHHLQCCVWA